MIQPSLGGFQSDSADRVTHLVRDFRSISLNGHRYSPYHPTAAANCDSLPFRRPQDEVPPLVQSTSSYSLPANRILTPASHRRNVRDPVRMSRLVQDFRNVTLQDLPMPRVPPGRSARFNVSVPSNGLPTPNRPPHFMERRALGYPMHITETASRLPLGADTCQLWRQVLEYWFSERQGFRIAHDWQPPDDTGNHFFSPLLASLVVLWDEYPIVTVQIHSVSNVRGSAENEMKMQSDRLWDRTAVWSPHPNMCAISANGLMWGGYLRSTDMTSEQAKAALGNDWVGEWKDSITSKRSFRMVGQYFRLLKSQLPL
ncbi:hypothetical protein FA15DRAFT_668016 [Coprinopsis marcescibilis]|uniref:Uncharacterized protein n=1 Tax=Coprinopsis marcescibilis TaxID=230819 RepID=A0A5C3KYY8_COPMA|nr:hypothetical protein FA15DRAFT_668016 [Coprinopsis marcescibilis]